jgi:hypothetical protein
MWIGNEKEKIHWKDEGESWLKYAKGGKNDV